jgi:sugar transferase (PEP-CTERM system associated)
MRVLGQNVSSPFLLLGVAEFVGGLCAFLVSSAFISSLSGNDGVVEIWPPTPWGVVFGIAVVTGMVAMGLYQPKQRLKLEGVIARQLVGLLIAAIFLAVLNFLVDVSVSGSVWMLSIALTIPLLVAFRAGFWALVDRDAFRRRVLVLGAGQRASSLLQLRRRSDQRGFKLVAFLPADGDSRRLDDPRVTEQTSSLMAFAQSERVNEIVVAMDDRRQNLPISDLLECRFAGIDIVDLLTFLERETGRVAVDLVTPDWLIFSGGFTSNTTRDFVLRVMDLLIVLLTAIATAPLMLIIALAIVLEDGFPVFYRQERAGLRGESFMLYKFRSMVKNAEADGKARWASRGDSRITRVGNFTRKYRLDELPQLLNVLKGDMSLVGPRPERPEFVQELSRQLPYYAERHCVKPGMTGWAQMSYPYGSSEADAMAKLAYDLYYVKHRSVIFNLVILLQTAEVVLWSKGAR